jgi:hypothetical protein
MQESRNNDRPDHPLRHLTEAQFMALGSNAVVYVKHVRGDTLTTMLPETGLDGESDYHIVVSADGQPLMVADSEEAVADWLSGQNVGIVTLH